VDGAAIFSAGGGGDPEVGYNIVDRLVNDGYVAELLPGQEVPNDAIVANFACVGATTSVGYRSKAAMKTLEILQEYVGKEVFAVIPVELGGFNTLAAVDVAARHGMPVVDGDGAGRSVPEVHLKVYTIDNIPLAPMAVADVEAQNVVLVKQTSNSKSAERIARALAAEWGQTAYTARRLLTGRQVKTSPILNTLSKAIRIGTLLRKAVDPIGAVLKETGGFKLFEGQVSEVERETRGGFTWTTATLNGIHEDKGSKFRFKAKNEILVAYKDERLSAVAPDIVTPVHSETGRCITAEKIKRGDNLVMIGIPAPEKWRAKKGLELWEEVLYRSNIKERYFAIEKLFR
jgi:hypothetical protein